MRCMCEEWRCSGCMCGCTCEDRVHGGTCEVVYMKSGSVGV